MRVNKNFCAKIRFLLRLFSESSNKNPLESYQMENQGMMTNQLDLINHHEFFNQEYFD